MKVRIDPEFRALIPPLTKEEREQLEANLFADGCREALVTWDGTLLDGHNRYDICSEYNIPYETREIELKTRDDAKVWIIKNQFGRRNLSNIQRAELALLLRPLIAAKAKENQREHGGTAPGKKSLGPILGQVSERKTDRVLEKIAGVGHATIHKVAVIQKEAPEALKERVRSGEISINRAYDEVRPIAMRKPGVPGKRQEHTDLQPPSLPKCRVCGHVCRWCQALATKGK